MAWTNIFDLSNAEVYFLRGLDEEPLPIANLPSGTIEVVDGVIQCRGLPKNLESMGVGGVLVVTNDSRANGASIRVRVQSLNIPAVESLTLIEVGTASGAPINAESFAEPFDAVYEGQDIIGVTPDQFAIGGIDTEQVPPLGGYWIYVESEPA